jgi:hypothetical protein
VGNLKKRILSFAMMLTLAASLSTSAFADTAKLSFQIDSKDFVTPAGEQDPYINGDGRTMVPIRFVGNALGVNDNNITWKADNQTATVNKDGVSIEITVGKRYITTNGTQVQMDTAAELTEGRLFIPARYISEALGARVEWDGAKNRIYILSDKNSNLARFAFKDIKLPIKFEGESYDYTLNQAFVLQAGTDEFNDYVKNNNLNVGSDTTFLIKTNFTLKNKGTGTISWSNGNDSKWFISEAHGNTLNPLSGSDSLNAGSEATFNQVYASNTKDINQLIFYFENGSITKDLIIFQ